jgi:hypothetical protein
MRLPRHFVPRNDGAGGWDCNVVQPKAGWIPHDDGFDSYFNCHLVAVMRHACLSPYRIKNNQMLLYKNEK